MTKEEKHQTKLLAADERPEEAASTLNCNVRTLERRSSDGTGPKMIRISPRNRRVRLGEISGFLDKSEDACSAA